MRPGWQWLTSALVFTALTGCRLAALPGQSPSADSALASAVLGSGTGPEGSGVQVVPATRFRLRLREINEAPVVSKVAELRSTLGGRHFLDFEVQSAPNFSGELEIDVRFAPKESAALMEAGAKSALFFGIQPAFDASPVLSFLDGTPLPRYRGPRAFRIPASASHRFRVDFSVLPQAPSFNSGVVLVSVTEVSSARVRERALVPILVGVDPTLEFEVWPKPNSEGAFVLSFPGRAGVETDRLLRVGSGTKALPTSRIRGFREGLRIRYRNFTDAAHELRLGGALRRAHSGRSTLTLPASKSSDSDPSELVGVLPPGAAEEGGIFLGSESTSAARYLILNDSSVGQGEVVLRSSLVEVIGRTPASP